MNATDDATQRLHDMVSLVKESPKARDAYMMWEEMIFYERRDAKEEGREEGRAITLITAIRKKLEKNKSTAQIADELELTVEEIEKYIAMMNEE